MGNEEKLNIDAPTAQEAVDGAQYPDLTDENNEPDDAGHGDDEGS